jgi:uncharacterized protein (TIGR04255 family)
LFLANPIIKPERFQKIIENEFKDKFQKFETINQLEFQLENPVGKSPTLNQQFLNNVGFKFLAFDRGENVRALQGINEKGRNFISFHEFDYKRWHSYYEEYINIIKIISNFHPEFFVTAVSVHYIDQFLWNSTENIDLNLLFNESASYIPKGFFDFTLNSYSIVFEKNIDGNIFIDRLEVKVGHQIRPMITISHNVTQPLSDITDLSELLKSEMFSIVLNACHSHNKEILENILTDDVKTLIKLNRNK